MFLAVIPKHAYAEVVDDVRVEPKPNGYQITLDFIFPLSYQSHSPSEPDRELRIQLIPTNFQSLTAEEVDALQERIPLSWDHTTGVPIAEITFEGGDPENPQITFLFTEDVSFEVRSSLDLHSLIVTIEVSESSLIIQQISATIRDIEQSLKEAPPETPQAPEPNLLIEAKQAMTDGDYTRAVQLFTKLKESPDPQLRKQAHEFLGLARERNGQLAHAKAEYESYLEQYPDGPDAARVRQRLAGLITAAKAPKEPLAKTKAPRILGIEKKLEKWDTRFYGSLSQFYFRDQTTPEGETTQINRDDLTTDVNFNARFRNENYDMRMRYAGSYTTNFVPDQDDEDSISNLSFEMENKNNGLFGKVGRQSRTSGGVLGRFDGAHVAYAVNPNIKLNTVFGMPVDSSKNTYVDYDKKFYGVSADLGTFRDAWNFVAFFINQDNNGITDRRAIGGEIRYFEMTKEFNKSFFSLVDYDVFYKTLNILLLNGRMSFPTKTVFNIIYDYRNSPIMTTNNAIQGQGVSDLGDLFDTYTEDQLNQLAEDRTAISKSLTFSVTQDLKEDVQLTGEVTASEFEGTVASGGVDAIEGTGVDMTYGSQLIFTNFLYEGDALITGIRYTDASTNDTITLTINGRLPFKRKLRFIPKFRFDYRTEKDSSDNRITVRPALRVDYQFQKWLRFETEGGIELRDEKSSDVNTKSTESYIIAGFRVNF